MPASRYAFYLPWLADSPAINAQIRGDLAKSRPPVIIFPRHLVFHRVENDIVQRIDLDQYGRGMRQELAKDYVVADENDPVLQGLLLRKDRADDLRQRLRTAGL